MQTGWWLRVTIDIRSGHSAWRGLPADPRSVTHGIGMLRNLPVLSSRMLVMCTNWGHYTLRLISARLASVFVRSRHCLEPRWSSSTPTIESRSQNCCRIFPQPWLSKIPILCNIKPCKEWSSPRNRPWRPTGLWDVEDSTLSRQSAHIWRQGLSVLRTGRALLPQKHFSVSTTHFSRSQWPSGIGHELFSPAPTLRSWVRIPLRHGCLCVFCERFFLFLHSLKWDSQPT
jgi:hypothetical protein